MVVLPSLESPVCPIIHSFLGKREIHNFSIRILVWSEMQIEFELGSFSFW